MFSINKMYELCIETGTEVQTSE